MAVLGLLLAACGEQGVMDGLGERSHEYVKGPTTTTLFNPQAPTETASPGVAPVEDARWFNEGIDGEIVGEVNQVVAGVWIRGSSAGRFIQASPAEIATALPNLDFPSVMPDDARWITSQLVYDTASATLDIETAAAFGMWSVRPYSEDEGRLAVLRVGMESGDSEVGSGIISSPVDSGLNLAWSDGVYTYELFCRTEVPEDVCWEMVESSVPFSIIAPEPAEVVEG